MTWKNLSGTARRGAECFLGGQYFGELATYKGQKRGKLKGLLWSYISGQDTSTKNNDYFGETDQRMLSNSLSTSIMVEGFIALLALAIRNVRQQITLILATTIILSLHQRLDRQRYTSGTAGT
jgi:hypothetical protein